MSGVAAGCEAWCRRRFTGKLAESSPGVKRSGPHAIAFYAPATATLIPRNASPASVKWVHEGRGPRHEAEEVARRLGAGDVEVPLTPLDEIILIMETVDTVLAQARGDV
jgi:hypothetical protein